MTGPGGAPPAATRPAGAAAERERPAPARYRRRLADREGALAWLLLAPAVVYILALVGVPFLLAVAFSFSDVTGGDPSFDWTGLQNFERVFADPVFWRALRNTLVFTALSMVFIVLFGK